MTGASGFIGTHLMGRLTAEAHEVFVLPSARFGGERLAGMRYAMVERASDAGAEVVYHLAGTPLETAVPDHEHASVVVGGMTRLLEELRGTPGPGPLRRLVVAGSAAEYGPGHGWRETDAPQPDTVFGMMKLAAGDLARASGLGSVVLRLFTPFGEGEPARRLVPSVARAALAGEPVRLRSTGTQTRDYFYVSDAVDALVEAGRRPLEPGVVINICTGVERRVIDVARRIAELSGSRAPVEAGLDQPTEMARSSGDPERARRLLGWRPRVDFDEGLRRAIGWCGRLQQQEQEPR